MDRVLANFTVMRCLFLLASWSIVAIAFPHLQAADWKEDFRLQPTADRPPLKVRYAGGSRDALEVTGQTYHVTGGLRAPHYPTDSHSGKLVPGLSVDVRFWFRNDQTEAFASRWTLSHTQRMHWENAGFVANDGQIEFPPCPPKRRFHVYGKLPIEPLRRSPNSSAPANIPTGQER